LSYESGYFDQSHFINDFKSLCDLTPKQYFAENEICSDFLRKFASLSDCPPRLKAPSLHETSLSTVWRPDSRHPEKRSEKVRLN